MNLTANYHPNKPPHIILLVLDTHRLDRLSCYGFKEPISPHIDEFAKTATRFTQAISPAQWTVPAHGSFFTGLYPSQHQLLQVGHQLNSATPTLIEILHQKGYATAGFSNNPLVGIMNNGLERGFDHLVNYASSQYQKQAKTPSGPSKHIKQLLAGLEQPLANQQWVRQLASHPAIYPLLKALFLPGQNVKGDTRQSLLDASQWLIQHSETTPHRPGFLFINLMGPHQPYAPAPWAVDHFVPQWAAQNLADKLKEFKQIVQGLPNILSEPLATAQASLLNGLYNAEVATQDALLGQFFDCLDHAKLLDDSFIIIVADHGENLGEHHLLGHSYGVYQGLIQVPCLVRDPRGILPAGHTVSQPVSMRRIYHTLLSVSGSAQPEQRHLAFDSLFNNGPPDSVFSEAWPERPQRLENRTGLSVREQQFQDPHFSVYQNGYKLIATPKQIIGLYHPETDPAEAHNLHPDHPELAQELHQHLQTHWSQNPTTAPTETAPAEESFDPGMIQRMRDLGYLD